MAKKNFYAVRSGRNPGIYKTWAECQKEVIGFAGAAFKGFETLEEAREFMSISGGASSAAQNTSEVSSCKTSSGKKAAGSEEKTDAVSPAELSMQTGAAVAYVDGSYYSLTNEFACGVVFCWQGEELHFSEKYEDPELAQMHNVAGEIRGAELAMRYAAERGIPKLIIYHDYEGIAKWPMGDWQAKKEGTIAYKKVYEELSARVDISFRKVKGHSGDIWNDLADSLAKQALGL